MFPTPLNSFWLSNALLMGVLRPRKSAMKRLDLRHQRLISGRGESRGLAIRFATTASRPNRRGSTNRSSLPDASFSDRMRVLGHLGFRTT